MSIQKKNSFIQAASEIVKKRHPSSQDYEKVAKALAELITSQVGVTVRVQISADPEEIAMAIREMEAEGGEA